MNKQAYEKSVGYALSKQADFDWQGLWDSVKKHFVDNKKHYIRGAMVGIPSILFGGAMGGRTGAGLGLLAGIAAGLGSKGWDWMKQNAQDWYDKGYNKGLADYPTVSNDVENEAQDYLYNNDPSGAPPRNR